MDKSFCPVSCWCVYSVGDRITLDQASPTVVFFSLPERAKAAFVWDSGNSPSESLVPAGEHLYSWVSITDQRDPEHLSTPPASLNLFDFILSNCGG